MADFVTRHVGTWGADQQAMLELVGVASTEELMCRAMPPSIVSEVAGAKLPEALGEAEVSAELSRLAAQNTVRTSMIGQGFYDTVTPAAIRRGILENPSWYTAYTPYQPEISQGRLEALLNFQTMVSELTGLEIAGASLLDEATAAAEAVALAVRAHRHSSKVAVDRDIFPQTAAVLAGRSEGLSIELVPVDVAGAAEMDLEGFAGLLVQYPGASGQVLPVDRYRQLGQQIHEAGGLFIMIADLLACTLLVPPGQLGADIAAGTTQRFGVPMNGGGPHAGYIATTKARERQLPGRLVGVSRDSQGNPALRLALQTREQHIRREKATSNICTAQSLLAIMASMYAVYHGPEGLRAIAERIHGEACALAEALTALGLEVEHESFFDTLSLRLPGVARRFAEALLAENITVFAVNEDTLRLSCDELTTPEIRARIVRAWTPLREAGVVESGVVARDGLVADSAATQESPSYGLPAESFRTDEYLHQRAFHAYRSETQLMRYMRRLAAKDYALDRGMIPLGSCTMKLNSAVELTPITYEGFARIHPFAPREDLAGYEKLIVDLEAWLADITGYDAVSLQPNAGSQGEFAGLLAIRGYHLSRGEGARNICLIPASAHGTNAASAVMAGFKVVVVKTGDDGSIDMDDLDRALASHADTVGVIMITYPSTHGTYEPEVTEVTAKVHAAGGQVYIDGANLNALVGYGQPGAFGGDVSHLNLHKTFAIPHGGGGPGVGPVCARSHLAPFLPGFPGVWERERPGHGAVSGAPWGSAAILPITWAYIRLMGRDGLRAATAGAVLAANYVAKRLEDRVPVLYRGPGGFVGHECILDVRPLKSGYGISVDDVAKRLIDYGFHAPTMSFPVPGTLMVEPTESEDLDEIDRFCDAIEAIVDEAERVGRGEWSAEDNPLVGAPHTAELLLGSGWNHAYSREEAAYPGIAVARRKGRDPERIRQWIDDKYWPPIGRVDGPWGDRNLQCTCPPPEAYES